MTGNDDHEKEYLWLVLQYWFSHCWRVCSSFRALLPFVFDHPSVLAVRLSLYRHPSIYILFSSHFTSYNKQHWVRRDVISKRFGWLFIQVDHCAVGWREKPKSHPHRYCFLFSSKLHVPTHIHRISIKLYRFARYILWLLLFDVFHQILRLSVVNLRTFATFRVPCLCLLCVRLVWLRQTALITTCFLSLYIVAILQLFMSHVDI